MNERPVIFSGPMVRAILDGRKTQTRRVVKNAPGEWLPRVGLYAPTRVDRHGEEYPGPEIFGAADEYFGCPCPYGQPGDRLWVRETLRPNRLRSTAVYAADGYPVMVDGESYDWPIGRRSWPSIHMPRWASRLTLEVVAVRVDRVQEITEEDARAEGVSAVLNHPGTGLYRSATGEFERLWDSINAKRGHSWESNPWVWVVEFRRIET